MKKKEKQKLLKDVCLHCAFFKMHSDKWGGWKPSNTNDETAFNDLVNSARRVVAEIFTMLSPHDQMMFFRNVFDSLKKIEAGGDSDPKSVAEVIEMFKAAISTKH